MDGHKMVNTWLTLLSICCVVSAGYAFQWLQLPDNSTVPACPGQNVSLLWNFTLLPNESVMEMEWYRAPLNGGQRTLLAAKANGHMLTSSREVHFVPRAGIRLDNVALNDSGIYSVKVLPYLHDGTIGIGYRRSVNLVISDDPVTKDGQLHARLVNSSREDKRVLTCGTVSPLWAPTVNVVWKTPDNQTVSSTYSANGEFSLVLPNPVVGGEYTCTIDDSSLARQCLGNDPLVRRGGSVRVDTLESRLALMESRMTEKERQVDGLVQSLTDQVERLSNLTTTLTGTVQSQEKEIQLQMLMAQSMALVNYNLTHQLSMISQSVSFHALDAGITYSSFSTVLFPDVKDNQGDAFNSTTGIFTVPITGTYSFHLTLLASNHSQHHTNLEAFIFVDHDSWARAVTSVTQDGVHVQGGCHVMAYLKAGQKVYVKNSYNGTRYNYGTAFSGVLLQASAP